ncbi:DUF4307 domain-containing protein [Microbacterium sp. BWT-B31]|uniref:DUF4307 domain-containing protein n=1 Tax=Microbacterium sp. BWT-B31 TaxID=3232072 RepID=UPI0035294BA8
MTTQDMLDERYGRTPSARTRWIVGIVIAVAVLAGSGVAWATWSNAANSVSATTTTFRVDGGRAVVVTYQATAPVGRAFACVIEAQDEEHGIVGWKVVEHEASDEHIQAFSESVPTVAQATTGLVNSCWVS